MICPVCWPARELQPTSIDASLAAFRCPGCQGTWVRNDDYLGWMRLTTFTPGAARPAGEARVRRSAAAPDVEPALRRCPDCGTVLARYRVGEGVDFVVDHCRRCAGTWLDDTEWEVLRERGLHDDLLHVFTDEWQQGVRDAERRARLEDEFHARLGDADLARVREFKAWLDAHPRRPELMAFLQSRPGLSAAPPA